MQFKRGVTSVRIFALGSLLLIEKKNKEEKMNSVNANPVNDLIGNAIRVLKGGQALNNSAGHSPKSLLLLGIILLCLGKRSHSDDGLVRKKVLMNNIQGHWWPKTANFGFGKYVSGAEILAALDVLHPGLSEEQPNYVRLNFRGKEAYVLFKKELYDLLNGKTIFSVAA